jgi:hypothetical protein
MVANVAEKVVRTLYRGSNGSGLRIEGGIAPDCLFAASSEATARLYGDDIERIGVRSSARILVEGTAEFSRVAKRRRGPLLRVLRHGETLKSAADAAVASASAAGYDAVEFTSMADMGIAIMNQSAFVRNMPTEDSVDDRALSGRTVVLYHGCASFDAVMSEGLIFDPARTNEFGEGGYLQSCGGTYLTDSIEVAAFYANNATCSEYALGCDPAVFAVEIDEALLIADEDKIWDPMRVIIETASRRRMDGNDLDLAEARLAADEFLFRHGDEASRRMEEKFLLKGKQFDRDQIGTAIRAFIVRATSYEWDPASDEMSAEIDAINSFCSLASRTISRRWLSGHYDQFALSCRTMHAISVSDGPARIVGHIRLRMGELGMSVEGVDFAGHFDEGNAIDFEESFIEKASERSGCEIEAYSWNEVDELCV